MRQITEPAAMQTEAAAILRAGKKHGFVPTMGNLHAGHRTLIDQARADGEIVTVSIFVNPTQFNDGADFENYPRTLAADLQLCATAGVDYVFTPTAAEIYAPDRDILVIPDKLANPLCGLSRGRGHFIGVCTVVAKLFNLVRPDRVYFGQKDAQQALIIQRMISDLNFPVKMSLLPTVREADGLALSSRNRLLTKKERQIAPQLYAALQTGAQMLAAGESRPHAVIEKMMSRLSAPEIEIDYLNIVDLATLTDLEEITGDALIAAAIKLGDVRLIDNVIAGRANSALKRGAIE
ncbi:pantothenate synthetase [Planctomycetales bacterium]|nr:pantothenate synthetase [Planctomycetales bacterium]